MPLATVATASVVQYYSKHSLSSYQQKYDRIAAGVTYIVFLCLLHNKSHTVFQQLNAELAAVVVVFVLLT